MTTKDILINSDNCLLFDGKVEFSVYQLSKAISEEQFSALLDDWLNNYNGDYTKGQRVSKNFHNTHPTLQGSLIRFALGILVGMVDSNWVDPRNETPVGMCRKVKEMVEKGELDGGYMI